MPTPSDDTLITSHVPITTSSRTIQCPPEHVGEPTQLSQHERSVNRTSPAMPIHTPIESTQASAGAAETPSYGADTPQHSLHLHEAMRLDTPSPGLEESTNQESDSAVASIASPKAATNFPPALPIPESPNTKQSTPQHTTSLLRHGSKFVGTQQSDRQIYNVEVEIKHVDMAESFICGYLRIEGLTDSHPQLTTYFEGEIIGTKYSFHTRHAEWGSSEKVDMMHWNRFPAWRPLARAARRPDFVQRNFADRENIFMRWKEYFLVPDHRVRTISGASFEGFYYICFNQVKGTVSGIYFHAKSERWQQLELEHVEDHGCLGAMEFR